MDSVPCMVQRRRWRAERGRIGFEADRTRIVKGKCRIALRMEFYNFFWTGLILLSFSPDAKCLEVYKSEMLTFTCNVTVTDVFKVFTNAIEIYYQTDRNAEDKTKISMNNILENARGFELVFNQSSDNQHFMVQIKKGEATMADSGFYTCKRADSDEYLASADIKVVEKKFDVDYVTFSIQRLSSSNDVQGEKHVAIYDSNIGTDPVPPVASIESGYFRVMCDVAGGEPAPMISMDLGNMNKVERASANALLNSSVKAISCHVQVESFSAHHLQINVDVQPGHPSFLCDSRKAKVGDTTVNIGCVVDGIEGKNIECDNFMWMSRSSGSVINDMNDYNTTCKVNSKNSNELLLMLTINKVKESDFMKGFELHFESEFQETYLKPVQLIQEKDDTSGAIGRVASSSTVALVVLSMLAMLV